MIDIKLEEIFASEDLDLDTLLKNIKEENEEDN